jgi:hypothetical protein
MGADVFLDDNRIDYQDTDCDSTVGHFIMAIEEQLSGLERVISGVSINGIQKADWHRAEVFGRLLKDCSDVRIYTSTMHDVINAGLDACRGFLSLMSSSGVLAVASLKTVGNKSDGYAAILRMLDYSYELVKTVRALDQASKRHNLRVFKEDPLKQAETLVKSLDSLRKLKESKDNEGIIALVAKDILQLVSGLEKCFDKISS